MTVANLSDVASMSERRRRESREEGREIGGDAWPCPGEARPQSRLHLLRAKPDRVVRESKKLAGTMVL